MTNHEKIWSLFNWKNNKYFEKNFIDVMQRDNNFLDHDFFYKEIYKFDWSETGCIYEMSGCKIHEGDVVVDLGANVGLFTKYAAEKASKVIAVEGSPQEFSCLVKNTTEEHSNIDYINANVVPRSLDEYNTHGSNPSKLTITLYDIFKKYNIESINFLKIDIEGTEYDIINDLDDDILSKIGMIAVECHTESRNNEIYLKLKDKKSYYFNWNLGNRIQKTLYFY